ncbi:MAG: two-component regulator propeller domain-containing protein [Candidatus Promineifilaceae bacterium]
MAEEERTFRAGFLRVGPYLFRYALAAFLFSILAACGNADTAGNQLDGDAGPSEIVAPGGSGDDGSPIPLAQSVAVFQSPLMGDSNINFEQISVEQGLSQSSVHAILQDHYGFMWFGTLDGLNRYDGYDIRVYKHDSEDPSSISDNMIKAIYEDSEGILWIGTSAGGLNRFDRESETFSRYQHDPEFEGSLGSNAVQSIFEDRYGDLWVGTSGGGLNKLDRSTGQITRYQNDPNYLYSLSNNTVQSIFEDGSGNLWIATYGGGLNRYDRESERFTNFQNEIGNPRSLINNYVSSVTQDEEGRLWVGTRGGVLHRFNLDNELFYRYQSGSIDPDSLADHAVSAIVEDRTGKLWVATNGGGVKLFDRQSGQFSHFQNDLTDPNSLSSNNVRSMFEDRSGVLWLGTDGGGVNKFSSSSMRFQHIQNDPGDPYSLSSNDVLAIHEDRDGDLWVGTLGGGLNRFEQDVGRLTRYSHEPKEPNSLSSNIVFTILQDAKGDLWIGTSSGLDRLDPESGLFEHFQNEPDNANSISHNVVLSISEDQSGVLWIGTSGGLNKYDPSTGRFNRFLNEPQDSRSLSRGSVRAIHDGGAGFLWIATDNGLDRFESKTGVFTHFRNDPNDPNSLSDDRVLAIHEDENGFLWIGTYGGGLNRLDPKSETFTNFREKDGLPNDAILGILEDEDGNLWLSTIQGLSRFDPSIEVFRNYDTRDGLQSNEFNVNASYEAENGKMYFGGINGFNAFFPGSITDNPYIPSIVLTTLTQGGESIDISQTEEGVNEVIFRWPNDFFEFGFSALSYSQPDKNQYAYQLTGYDQDWNYLGTRRTGRYANIPAGDYVLKLRGSNNDGIWNEDGVSLNITVVPPFWQTSWFRVLVAVTVIGGIALGYRLRVRGIEARTRELENQVEERTHDLELRTHELERRKNAAEGLREILIILNSNRSLEESLDYIVHQVAILTGADEVAIFKHVLDIGPSIIASFLSGPEPNKGIMVEPVASRLLDGHSVIYPNNVNHEEKTPISSHMILNGYKAILGLPLSIGSEPYGGLVLYFSQNRTFSDEDIELSSTFADQAMLAIANDKLRDRAEQTAVAMERSRLARDLHDAVTQTLFSASLIAEVMPAAWEADHDEGRHLLKELRQLSRGALAEMRTLLLELRPAALAEASIGDLLRQLADSLTGRTGTRVDLFIEGPCELPSEVHVTLYRIAQEALNNVVKHANATKVSVSLKCYPSALGGEPRSRATLVVSDNGDGFDPDCITSDCLGLTIMRERAQAVGVVLNIESQMGQGTIVTVRWKESMLDRLANGVQESGDVSSSSSTATE